ncbi:MAG: hypothetical protein OHK0023_28190 [Anaerolineae bacterium]
MAYRTWRIGLFIGIALITPLVMILYLASVVVGVVFPAFPVFDGFARILPGPLVTTGIDTLVAIIRGLNLGRTDTTAKIAEQLMGIGLFIVIGLVASLVYASWRRNLKLPRFHISGLVLGLAIGLPITLIALGLDRGASASPVLSGAWLIFAFSLWGMAHSVAAASLDSVAARTEPILPPAIPAMDSDHRQIVKVISRREFLIQLGGISATVTVVGAGLSALFNMQSTSPTTGAAAGSTTPIPPQGTPVATAGLVPAPGTRPEITPVSEHYRIDIVTGAVPSIDEASYSLVLDGLVETASTLTLSQIRDLPRQEQYITMSCISNPIAGDLISTTRWIGVSMQEIVALAKPTAEATHIKIYGADGFFEILDMALIAEDPRLMLTYAWDGMPLPERNGFPLRVHIPDRYGMKQPKWITRMEFISQWEPGYWVVRGWDQEARVRATSVIDTIATNDTFERDGKTFVPVGGIAWSGVRGISKVEVSVDGGNWVEAQLRPAMSDKTWVIWRYDWEFQPGAHTFAVRCTELDGTPQIVEGAGVRPSGATGIHSRAAVL